jgi:phosphate-selective porin
MAANLGMFLVDSSEIKTDLTWGVTAGFLAGIWTFCAIAIHSLFELKSWRYILINGGYSIVSLTLMGAIIGLWR